jgi:Phosphotransferase system IIB components
MMIYMQYGIIFLVTIIIAFAIVKSKRKDFKLEANKLISCLGGKDNIISYESNNSRFVVELKNIEIVNKEMIQKMGAKGIVEIENQLKIILGENAVTLKKYIDTLK